MSHIFIPLRCAARLFLAVSLSLAIFVPAVSQVKRPADTVAGIPVNYRESKVGTYTLPEALRLADGRRVTTPAEWYDKRRPEILEWYKDDQFGHAPPAPRQLPFDVFDKGTLCYGGQARRKQVTVYLTKDTSGVRMDLLVYLPAHASGPVPVLLTPGFFPNCSRVDDPGVRRGFMWNRDHQRVPAPEKSPFGGFDVLQLTSQGFGVAMVYYGDIEPDFPGGIPYGVEGAYLKPGQSVPGPRQWGTIAAWAWGLSRALDYLQTDKSVDAKRVALFGVSRLGKTVLWTAANDPRFALVIASCSGEGGAALSRRNYGETIAHLTAPTRYPYQFCAHYGDFAKDVEKLPVDGNMLLSLIAPRPVLLQTGDEDYWSDPKGEFLAAVAASPVFTLLGATGVGIREWPPAGKAYLNTLGYYMHHGGHGALPGDWKVFIAFMNKYLKP
jgi:hypothetical protein